MIANLGEFVNIKTGKLDANAAHENGKYPFFTCAVEPLFINTYSYECECVLVAGNGDLNVKYYNGKFDAYQRTYIIESKNKNKLTVPYIYRFMEKYVEKLRNQSIGCVIKYIKLENLTHAKISLRTINEQNNIVATLDTIDSLIDQRKEQLATLDTLVKSQFVEMFGEYETTTTLAEVSDMVTVGIANSATHAYRKDGTVMLRNQNIRENFLDDDDLLYIDPAFADKYKTKMLKTNDILVTRTGYPGIACIVPSKYEGAQTFTTLIVRISHDSDVLPSFVCHYINSDRGRCFVAGEQVGVAQQNFGAKSLAKMPIPTPSITLQKRYADFVALADKSKFDVQQSIDALDTLKRKLMQDYFG